MNALLVIGLAFVVLAALFFIVPSILKRLKRQGQTGLATIARRRDRPSYDAPIDQQVTDLRVDDSVELDPTGKTVPSRFITVSRGTFSALNRRGTSFTDRSEHYLTLILRDQSGQETFLLQRPDGWFVFNQELRLFGDEARQFYAFGEEFSRKGQVPGSVSFDWRSMPLSIIDVGYMRYKHEASQEGEAYLSDSEMIKYFIAMSGEKVVFLEDHKGAGDRVWVGRQLDDQNLARHFGQVWRQMK